MGAPPSRCFQSMLQAAVQSVQWTYSLFWQNSPPQGMLVWGDGYYNGVIKTRKTVQPMEVSAEEASLQRSEQLRELYDSLSAGETNPPTRRPCAALSPEDLTESEWFYLMCVSFSFPPGVGLPGKAFARQQHLWLTGANEVDSKTFSRAILAKSARIQTVVCIPLFNGVVEIGTTHKVGEDVGFVEHVKGFFIHQYLRQQPQAAGPAAKPALSEHSTSNRPEPTSSSSPAAPICAATAYTPQVSVALQHAHDDDDDDDDDNEHEHDGSDSETETTDDQHASDLSARHSPTRTILSAALQAEVAPAAAPEPTELMPLDMSENIRLGSPDDASNNLQSHVHFLASPTLRRQHHNSIMPDHSPRTHRWTTSHPPSLRVSPLPSSSSVYAGEGMEMELVVTSGGATGGMVMEEGTQEDAHYSKTVSTIVQSQNRQRQNIGWGESSASLYGLQLLYSAFTKWAPNQCANYHRHHHHHHHKDVEGGSSSQLLLKFVLFNVPYLHGSKPRWGDGDAASRLRKGTSCSQEELSANHVLAERRRREKLNERFIILRSLVPFVTKMDKASILGDTIEYVKQLRKRIQDLETHSHRAETDQPPKTPPQRGGNLGSVVLPKDQRIIKSNAAAVAIADDQQRREKRKLIRTGEQHRGDCDEQTSVQVSIIESDGLLELQCGYREGLLLDVMQTLRDHKIETTAVHSSLTNGLFVAELRAKVNENVHGRKTSIVEVKKAIHQIIPP